MAGPDITTKPAYFEWVSTITLSVLLVGCANLPLSHELESSGSVPSQGTVSYHGPTPILRVNGSRIIDSEGREVVLRGFNIWENDWAFGFLDREPYAEQWARDQFMPLSLAHMQQIESWGLNVIRVPLFWTYHFEADENDVGNYGKFVEGYPLMPLLKTLIRMANSTRLYVIPSIRVCFDPVEMPFWAGWATHDYVVYNQTDSAGMHGLTRFTNFLEWFVRQLDPEPNVIGFDPWLFPYHRQDVPETDERVDRYNTIVTPAMFSAIRAHSKKIIFWNPIHQGGARDDSGRWQETGRYRIGVPPAFSDKNIVYGIGGYGNDDVVSHGGGYAEVWDYDVSYLSSQYDYGRAYQELYNVPMYCVETGLNIHAEGVNQRPIRRDRVDFYKALQTIFDDYPRNWIYWEYSGPVAWFGVLDGEDPNNPTYESPMVSVLKEHSVPNVENGTQNEKRACTGTFLHERLLHTFWCGLCLAVRTEQPFTC